MARILLSAYACEPGRGSEPGVGWSWATELGRLGHDVSVLTRASNRSAIEPALPWQCENPNFLYYDLPPAVQRCRRWPAGKIVYYVLWQWFAARWIRRRFSALPFDLVQHVTYVSARYPSFMGSLGIPFIFGPVSGGERAPSSLRAGFSTGQRWREWLRDVSNALVPLDLLMRRTFAQATAILVTRDTLNLVPLRWRQKCSVRLAVGLSEPYLSRSNQKRMAAGRPVQLLYVGRLLYSKGVDIALRAVGQLKRWYPDVRFTIIGEGPALTNLCALSKTLCLQNSVEWIGWLPQTALDKHYQAADLMLFPSLRDSGGLVVLEALANGLPVVCTDLGGPGVIVNPSCGRALATLGRTPQQLADDFANALRQIIATPNLLDSLACGARSRARQLNFENLVRSIHAPAAEKRLVRQA